MISAAAMPKGKDRHRPVTAEDRKLVKELTGQIIEAAEKHGFTREELAQRAGRKTASTLYGWRNGDSERPSLLDLYDFAKAVDLDVRLIDATPGNVGNSTHSRGDNLKPETADVVAVMEGGSDELRATIKAQVIKLITERASNPQEASVDQTGPRVRK